MNYKGSKIGCLKLKFWSENLRGVNINGHKTKQMVFVEVVLPGLAQTKNNNNNILRCQKLFNTQYMTKSTLVSPFIMEKGWTFSISGLKMMMKSGLGKIFLKFLHALTMSFFYWILIKSTNSVIEITWWAHGGISKYFS